MAVKKALPRARGRAGRTRLSARNRSNARHRARLASCGSYFCLSLARPMIFETPTPAPPLASTPAALARALAAEWVRGAPGVGAGSSLTKRQTSAPSNR